MIGTISKKLGVDYPWKVCAVNGGRFRCRGMENTSATTNTSKFATQPQLIPEFPANEDPLISHELGASMVWRSGHLHDWETSG